MADDTILDDPAALLEADPGAMLRAVASTGSQIRTGIRSLDADVVADIAAGGAPRGIVVTGMGGSGIAGQVFAALAATHASLPVVAHRGYQLPAWVGARDLVIALSASGRTDEAIAAAAEATRRGAALVCITADGSPLASLGSAGGNAWLIPVDVQGRMPRASLWTLLTPLLLIGDALGVMHVDASTLLRAADLADEASQRCGVEVPVADNPAKQLGLALAESLPLIWGSGDLGPVVAYRAASQLAENAKLPAIHGEIPESQHNQVVAFDGPMARPASPLDIFRDREDDIERTLRLVLLRDNVEASHIATRADIATELAEQRGIPVSEVVAEGEHPVHRLASLITVIDWASVYAALALHIDPTPITPIDELKARASAATRP